MFSFNSQFLQEHSMVAAIVSMSTKIRSRQKALMVRSCPIGLTVLLS
jgi:hypothetical protein